MESDAIARSRRCWKRTSAILVAVFLIVDFVPWHGPPSFRYTGSDPGRKVWNLGFPPMFIYDKSRGFQNGPFTVLLLPQAGVVAIAFGMMQLRAAALKDSSARES